LIAKENNVFEKTKISRSRGVIAQDLQCKAKISHGKVNCLKNIILKTKTEESRQ